MYKSTNSRHSFFVNESIFTLPCQDPVSIAQGWAPAAPQPGVYYDRDMEYIRDQVSIRIHRTHDIIVLSIFQAIYGVKDSGELVPPTAQTLVLNSFSPEEPSQSTERYPAAEYNLVYAIDKRYLIH